MKKKLNEMDLTNLHISLYCAIEQLANDMYYPHHKETRMEEKGWDDFDETEQENIIKSWLTAIRIIKKVDLKALLERRTGISLETGDVIEKST